MDHTPLPAIDGGWKTLVLDPPWRFGNKASRAAAANHYETMDAASLLRLGAEVRSILAPQSQVYLWTTDAHLAGALALMLAMGVDYKQTLVWVKSKRLGTTMLAVPPRCYVAADEDQMRTVQIGMGNYYRHAHELVLFGTRGKAKVRRHDLPSVFFAARGKHSAKPAILHEWAEAMGEGPRLELFARTSRPGWQAWGAQAPTSEAA